MFLMVWQAYLSNGFDDDGVTDGVRLDNIVLLFAESSTLAGLLANH